MLNKSSVVRFVCIQIAFISIHLRWPTSVAIAFLLVNSNYFDSFMLSTLHLEFEKQSSKLNLKKIGNMFGEGKSADSSEFIRHLIIEFKF